jgi:hypothetical protein
MDAVGITPLVTSRLAKIAGPMRSVCPFTRTMGLPGNIKLTEQMITVSRTRRHDRRLLGGSYGSRQDGSQHCRCKHSPA